MRNHVELTSRIREEATSIAVPVMVLVVGLVGVVFFEQMSAPDQRIWLVVLVCATVSSIAGFAFSALASSSLVHLADSPVYMVQIMLIVSTAIQFYAAVRGGSNVLFVHYHDLLASLEGEMRRIARFLGLAFFETV